MPDSPLTVSDGPRTAPEVVTLFVRQDGTFGENEGVSVVPNETVSWQPAHSLYTPTTAGYDFLFTCSCVHSWDILCVDSCCALMGYPYVCTHVVYWWDACAGEWSPAALNWCC